MKAHAHDNLLLRYPCTAANHSQALAKKLHDGLSIASYIPWRNK